MIIEMEIRTIDKEDINLGAEVSTDDVGHDLDIVLNAIKSGLRDKDWTSVIAKIYF